jgi:hypothetical protein
MNSPVRHNPGHHAADLAHDAQAGAEHIGEMAQGRGLMRVKVQHTKMQRARMLHNKMLAAAFYRGKRFAEGNHKPPPPSAQKLMRQLGQRPRPAPSAKGHGKDAAVREPREDAPHGPEQKHEHEHERKREQEQQKHGQQQKREHDQGQDRQGHGREHDQGQSRQHEHGHDQGQQGQERGQSQQGSPRDGQPKRDGRDSQEGREGRREEPRKFAIGKTGRAKAAARKQPLSAAMQVIARNKLGSPDLPAELAAACTKEVMRLTSQIELGPLLAVPLLLSMASPMVLKRNATRLHAHRNAVLMQNAATPGKAAATANLIGVSLDNTLARQGAGIEYSYEDQSIAAVKQRILDALAALPATSAKPAPKQAVETAGTNATGIPKAPMTASD